MTEPSPATGQTVHRLRRRMRGLRAQLLFTTLAPIIILLSAMVAVSVFGFTRLTQALIERRDAELVQLSAHQIAAYVGDSVLLLAQLAATDEARNGDIPAVEALMEANTALRQRFDALSLTDVEGTVVATLGGVLGQPLGDPVAFERARRLRRPVRSEVHSDSLGGKVITVSVPVYDRLRRFTGCLLGVWRLYGEALGVPVRNVRVGERGFAYLVDARGQVLFHPSLDMIGADVSQHRAVAALLTDGSFGSETVGERGIITVVSYAPVPLHESTNSLLADESWMGWGLLTAEYWDDITAPLRPYMWLLACLVLAVAGLPVAVLVINSRRVTAPVQSLAAQAERVSSGEFDTQVSIAAGPSEVRDLEIAFNKMVIQLRRYRADIQDYVVAILNSQEQERKRVARELHDETAQALVVLGRRIEAAQELASDPQLVLRLEEVRNLVDDTLQGVRRFTSDLRPPLLEELGLTRTIEILGARTAREEHVQVEVLVTGEPRTLPPELELALYRLTQEGLSNVRRHADATQVQVTLTYGEEAFRLEIRDNGVGFDVPTDPAELMRTGRLGLMGIHERARLFGGRAIIESEPGQGSTVTVVIPYATNALQSLGANEPEPRPLTSK